MTPDLLQIVVGVFAAVMSLLYLLRVNKLQFGRHLFVYVVMHDFLGAGCASTAAYMAFGNPPGLTAVCMVAAAACHLALTHIPGRTYEPPPYMQNHHQPAAVDSRGDLP